MTHNEFFDSLKRGEVRSVYLFQGEEEHVKARALAALEKKLLPEGLEALNETVLTNPPAGDVIAAAETLPMLSDRRLVLVKDSALLLSGKAAGEAEESEKLVRYLENPPETACVVFYCPKTPDGRKRLPQALARQRAVVQFDRLSDADLSRWMLSQLRPLGKTLSPESAALLAFTCGRDLLTLSQELSKLGAYAGERAEVTREDIEAVAVPSLECTVFQLVDALVAGKEAEAFSLLRTMLENGEARIGILAMMARQYRNLLQVKLLQEARVPEAEMQKKVGVPPFALRRLMAQARGMDAKALRRKLDLCVDTDYAIKSGRVREDAGLDRAMLTLCQGA